MLLNVNYSQSQKLTKVHDSFFIAGGKRIMDLQQLKNKLNEKLQKEYDNFIEKLKSLPPEQVIASSYEKVFKEELMTTVQYKDLSRMEINALLKLDHPLDSLYQEWLKNDFSYLPLLKDTVNDYTKKVIKLQKRDSIER